MDIFLKVKGFFANPALRSAASNAGKTVLVVGLGTAALKGLKAVARVGQAIFTKKVV